MSYLSSHSKNPSINSRFFNPRPKNKLSNIKIEEMPTAENYFDGSFDQISTGSLGDGGENEKSPNDKKNTGVRKEQYQTNSGA
jgi:hypothetical protein